MADQMETTWAGPWDRYWVARWEHSMAAQSAVLSETRSAEKWDENSVVCWVGHLDRKWVDLSDSQRVVLMAVKWGFRWDDQTAVSWD